MRVFSCILFRKRYSVHRHNIYILTLRDYVFEYIDWFSEKSAEMISRETNFSSAILYANRNYRW